MASPVSFAPFAIILTSLLAFPMMYVVNSAQAVLGELGLFVSGAGCLLLVCILTYAAIRKQTTAASGPTDWLLYGKRMISYNNTIRMYRLYNYYCHGLLPSGTEPFVGRDNLHCGVWTMCHLRHFYA